MAVSDADCGGDAWLLMAVPDTGCEGGDVLVLMAVPDAGGGRGAGSHGNPRRWLWVGKRQRFSWQSQTLVVMGRGGVLMAVPDAGCGGAEGGVLMAVKDAGCGGGEVGVLMTVPDSGCEEERQGFSWQS